MASVASANYGGGSILKKTVSRASYSQLGPSYTHSHSRLHAVAKIASPKCTPVFRITMYSGRLRALVVTTIRTSSSAELESLTGVHTPFFFRFMHHACLAHALRLIRVLV